MSMRVKVNERYTSGNELAEYLAQRLEIDNPKVIRSRNYPIGYSVMNGSEVPEFFVGFIFEKQGANGAIYKDSEFEVSSFRRETSEKLAEILSG